MHVINLFLLKIKQKRNETVDVIHFRKKSKDRVTMVKIWFDKVIIAYILIQHAIWVQGCVIRRRFFKKKNLPPE